MFEDDQGFCRGCHEITPGCTQCDPHTQQCQVCEAHVDGLDYTYSPYEINQYGDTSCQIIGCTEVDPQNPEHCIACDQSEDSLFKHWSQFEGLCAPSCE